MVESGVGCVLYRAYWHSIQGRAVVLTRPHTYGKRYLLFEVLMQGWVKMAAEREMHPMIRRMNFDEADIEADLLMRCATKLDCTTAGIWEGTVGRERPTNLTRGY